MCTFAEVRGSSQSSLSSTWRQGLLFSLLTSYTTLAALEPSETLVSHYTLRVPQILLYSVLYAFWGFKLGSSHLYSKRFSSPRVPATLQHCLTAIHKPPVGKLTVNSPVTASKPTWMVCSKSDGGEISGRSFSFFLLPRGHGGGERKIISLNKAIYGIYYFVFFLKLIRNEVIAEESLFWEQWLTGNWHTNIHPAGGCLQRHIYRGHLSKLKPSFPPPSSTLLF